MENSNQLVSIIIPVFNAEDYIARAIQSGLDQTYSPVEILVVDDGSTDGTAGIVKSFKEVKYFYQSNQGCASARNLGLKHSKGDFIAFIDADDAAPENKLEIQVGVLKKNKSTDIVICHLENRIEQESELSEYAINHFINREKISYMSMVVRRDVFNKVGIFDNKHKIASDFDWITRAKQNGLTVEIIPDILQYRYIHKNNISLRPDAGSNARRLKMIKEALDKKRKQHGGVQ